MSQERPFYTEYGELLLKTQKRSNLSREEKSSIDKFLDDFVTANLPQSLFRYRSCDKRSIDAFRLDRLYFNHPQKFNDPQDCLVFFDREKLKAQTNDSIAFWIKTYVNMLKTKQIPPEIRDLYSEDQNKMLEKNLENISEESILLIPNIVSSWYSQYEEEVEKTILVAKQYFRENPWLVCFSSEVTGPLMWSYYADSHKGFALEYNLSTTTVPCINCISTHKCSDFPVHGSLYPIVYTDEKYDATDYVNHVAVDAFLKFINFENLPNPYDGLVFRKANVFKSNYWAHEKEWRMEFNCSNDDKCNWMPLKPKAIYLGVQISPRNRKILCRLAEKKKMPVYQMNDQPDTIKYKLACTLIK